MTIVGCTRGVEAGMILVMNGSKKMAEFVDQAFRTNNQDRVLCPCNYCGNSRPQMRATMVSHLCRHGFCPDYEIWICHGETIETRIDMVRQRTEEPNYHETNQLHDMIDDVHDAYVSVEDEESEPTAHEFYRMLSASSHPLHEHTKVSQLDSITQLLAVKSQFGITISGFDAMLSVFCTLLPQGHKLPPNLYEAKKFLSVLIMPYEMCAQIIACSLGKRVQRRLFVISVVSVVILR
jgi:hypothetical protein